MEQGHFRNIAVFGNCQGSQLANCLRLMVPDANVEFFRYLADADTTDLVNRGARQLVLVQNPIMSFGPQIEALRKACKVIEFPAVAYGGFHPDLIRPKRNKVLIKGPLGSNHSAIVLYGYMRGFDEAATAALFREDVFRILGYFRARAECDEHLRGKLDHFGLLDEAEFTPLLAGPCFMHNTIHPKLPLIGALARVLLDKAGVSPFLRYPENLTPDDLVNNVVWPVYPEIARGLNLTGGEYVFQFKPVKRFIFGLQDFIAKSFEAYRAQAVDATCHARFAGPEIAALDALVARIRSGSTEPLNPYRAYPDHQFWRRAVVAKGHDGVDPVVDPAFTLDSTTRIGTAGSCFAQHIARRLAASGHAYLVTEAGEDLSAPERERRGYGVYSARYGNIYTARQLRQLFERAYGTFVPGQTAWQRDDGRFVDAFRPEIEPDGFASVEAVEVARAQHFAAVRKLFQEVDVLVFTLGLTEAWQSEDDGAVYPLCPMVVSTHVDAAAFAPVNFTQAEVLDELIKFLALLRTVNPAARVLLTVSPVPLIATFEPRHVLVSTTASKAVLRSAADEACRSDPAFCYFPSYEIVANPYFAASYFDPADARSVLPRGVDHVMRVFIRHHSSLAVVAEGKSTTRGLELDEEQQVVCEEERLDP